MRIYLLLFWACWMGTAPAEAAIRELKEVLYNDYRFDLVGFVEAAGGRRIHDDPHQKQTSLAEARLQLEASKYFEWGILRAEGDFVADEVTEEVVADLRELNFFLTPLPFLDLKVGRQIITWGTADMFFINDVFPKDWQSYFIGRDDEFLKAPTDAVRSSWFFDLVNIDAVYIPVATASEHISGERLSYWNPLINRTTGRIFPVDKRWSFPHDSEYAVRLFRTLHSVEMALYGYSGFWKTPEGLMPAPPTLYYPRLSVYGGSIRGPLLGGIGNAEIGYYDSREDRDGSDPFVRNSELRFLGGFEREIVADLTGGVQYYLEWMADHDAYERLLVPGTPRKDEYRHVVTLRLTQLLLNQNLILSLFCYYSPSDADGYLRPKVQYKLTDRWLLETGGNIFFGEEDHTFFGQFKENSNVYTRVRWSF